MSPKSISRTNTMTDHAPHAAVETSCARNPMDGVPESCEADGASPLLAAESRGTEPLPEPAGSLSMCGGVPVCAPSPLGWGPRGSIWWAAGTAARVTLTAVAALWRSDVEAEPGVCFERDEWTGEGVPAAELTWRCAGADVGGTLGGTSGRI
jgi:hypothetical protein